MGESYAGKFMPCWNVEIGSTFTILYNPILFDIILYGLSEFCWSLGTNQCMAGKSKCSTQPIQTKRDIQLLMLYFLDYFIDYAIVAIDFARHLDQ